MRKVYYFFIVFFAIFLVLEWHFEPSKLLFKKQIPPKALDSTYISDSALEIIVDDYAKGNVNDISEIFSQDYQTKQQRHQELIILNDQNANDITKTEPIIDNNFTQVKDTLTWKMLGVIKYLKKPHPDFEEGVMYPIINTTLKAMKGKRVIIKGFIIPVDTQTYALSKNVFASCFFCGQAGPETITGIKFRGSTPKLKTDQYVTLEGVFRYNDSNVDDWIYHIEDALIKNSR